MRVGLRRQPLRPELGIAGFDQIGYQGFDAAHFSAANLRDFFEAAAFLEQLERFVGRARSFGMPIGTGARALLESLQRREDFFSVTLDFLN